MNIPLEDSIEDSNLDFYNSIGSIFIAQIPENCTINDVKTSDLKITSNGAYFLSKSRLIKFPVELYSKADIFGSGYAEEINCEENEVVFFILIHKYYLELNCL